MLDLYNKKYDRITLKKHIYSVSLVDILKTQHLDVSFVVRYILNNTYQLTKEEETIDTDMVLKYQPHLTKTEIFAEQLIYDSDHDSIDDFEEFSLK
jgi:HJR/Mrr/RecB family endonuclease